MSNMKCRCRSLHLNATRNESDIVGHEWNPDCPQHGINSEWWQSPEQVAKRAEAGRRLRELQMQAREARRTSITHEEEGLS